jgi:hypothetical protein
MPKKIIKSAKTTENICFRLSQAHFNLLEEHGKNLRDDAGLPLSPSQAARRLISELIASGVLTINKEKKSG